MMRFLRRPFPEISVNILLPGSAQGSGTGNACQAHSSFGRIRDPLLATGRHSLAAALFPRSRTRRPLGLQVKPILEGGEPSFPDESDSSISYPARGGYKIARITQPRILVLDNGPFFPAH